jgi:hypothetical protein
VTQRNGATSPTKPQSTNGDLLYVSDDSTNDVYAFSYPSGKLALTLTGFEAPQGLCSDESGNVFITDEKAPDIVEYAHGGTTPIKTFHGSGRPSACWIDPTTGNLAVANVNGFVSIYKDARGHPTSYPTRTSAIFCAYDKRGDLYVDELGRLSAGNQVQVLAKGESSFKTMDLNKRLGDSSPAGIQWQGKDLVVAHGGSGHGCCGRVYRFIVDGLDGSHAGSFATNTDIANFVTNGSTLIATTLTGEIEYYEWPSGKGPTHKFSDLGGSPYGVTISVGASR